MDFTHKQHQFLDIFLEISKESGVTSDSIAASIEKTDIDNDEYSMIFPEGMKDIFIAYSDQINAKMLTQLQQDNATPVRVRDKIRRAVWVRLQIMDNYKHIEKAATLFWARKTPLSGAQRLWSAADIIWEWAGDTSTDHNHYTKRGLLSGVMLSTFLYWFNDSSEDYTDTQNFLDRRIDNVLAFGKIVGKPLGKIIERFSHFSPFCTRAPKDTDGDVQYD